MQDKEDLHYITSKLAVKINVNDFVYELISEISSDEETSDEVFEQYLVSPQGMGRTKQTGRKSETPSNPFVSAGQLPLAVGGAPLVSMSTRSSTGSTPVKRPILPSFSSDDDPDSDGSSRSKCPKKTELVTPDGVEPDSGGSDWSR